MELTKRVSSAVAIPVIASGGMGEKQHLVEIVETGGASAVAMADVLHYEKLSLSELKEYARQNSIQVRQS
jgi:imidazole glycerol-phosphate synthase subunit HisF